MTTPSQHRLKLQASYAPASPSSLGRFVMYGDVVHSFATSCAGTADGDVAATLDTLDTAMDIVAGAGDDSNEEGLDSAESGAEDSLKPPPVFGPGLMQARDEVLAVKPGRLHSLTKFNLQFVESDQLRYVAATGDRVVGVVVQKMPEIFRVDIGSSHLATLNFMSFENASKRNRVNLAVGDAIYARVSEAPSYMEPELECVDPVTAKSGPYGKLNGGFIFKTKRLSHCRSLLFADCPVVKALEKRKIKFEMAVGSNGKVWVKAIDDSGESDQNGQSLRSANDAGSRNTDSVSEISEQFREDTVKEDVLLTLLVSTVLQGCFDAKTHKEIEAFITSTKQTLAIE